MEWFYYFYGETVIKSVMLWFVACCALDLSVFMYLHQVNGPFILMLGYLWLSLYTVLRIPACTVVGSDFFCSPCVVMTSYFKFWFFVELLKLFVERGIYLIWFALDLYKGVLGKAVSFWCIGVWKFEIIIFQISGLFKDDYGVGVIKMFLVWLEACRILKPAHSVLFNFCRPEYSL